MKRGSLRIIGVASGLGARDPGCGKGPWAVKHSHAIERLADDIEWSDLIYPRAAGDRWERLADLAQRVSDEVGRTMAAGYFPVVIGGDHSCALGTWSGVAGRMADRGRIGLLWIDAHMDSHLPETSSSHAPHGMPVAVLLGLGQHDLISLAGRHPVLRPEHLCLLAARSYEEEETALLDRLGVRVIRQEEVVARGLSATLAEAVGRATAGTAGFGVSLDLDALDPAVAPGVGSPEPSGLAARELLDALAPVFSDPRLTALEIAEYNPEHDRNQTTLELIVDLLESLARHRASRC